MPTCLLFCDQIERFTKTYQLGEKNFGTAGLAVQQRASAAQAAAFASSHPVKVLRLGVAYCSLV
jgi:hypothetical protein